MQTIIIVLDSTKMNNPNLDICYSLPDRIESFTNGRVRDNGYDYISERACRVDYLLVSKKHRKTGAGRALFYSYVEWCRENGIEKIYIWPDGDMRRNYMYP